MARIKMAASELPTPNEPSGGLGQIALCTECDEQDLAVTVKEELRPTLCNNGAEESDLPSLSLNK